MSSMDEVAMCIRTKKLRPLGLKQGYSNGSSVNSCIDGILGKSGNIEWMRRGDVERDEKYRQVIVYISFTHDNWTFSYRRKGGDGRLEARRSIGVGGHVNEDDSKGRKYIYKSIRKVLNDAASREIAEEVEVGHGIRSDAHYALRPVGLINDLTDEVGRVHLGIHMTMELLLPSVTPRPEGCMDDVRFTSPTELLRYKGDYEGWSRIVIEQLC